MGADLLMRQQDPIPSVTEGVARFKARSHWPMNTKRMQKRTQRTTKFLGLASSVFIRCKHQQYCRIFAKTKWKRKDKGILAVAGTSMLNRWISEAWQMKADRKGWQLRRGYRGQFLSRRIAERADDERMK